MNVDEFLGRARAHQPCPPWTPRSPTWSPQQPQTRRKQAHCIPTAHRRNSLRPQQIHHVKIIGTWLFRRVCASWRGTPRACYHQRSLDANTAQLADVTKAIKSIVDGDVETDLAPAYQKYNEEQYTTTKLPGGSTDVLVSPYNSLGDGRYYDTETQSSFDFDHATQKASAVQSYVVESQHEDLV